MPAQSKHTVLFALGLAFLDCCCIVAAYITAIAITQTADSPFAAHFREHAAYLLVLMIVWCTAAVDQRLFLSRRSEALVPQLFGATKASFLSLMFMVFLMALFDRKGLDRPFVVLFGLCLIVFFLLFRLTVGISLWDLRRRGYNFRRILVVGTNERAAHLIETVRANEQYGFQIEGFLEDDADRAPILERYGVAYLGPIRALEEILVNRVIDSVYISLPVRSCYETIQDITHLCEGVGVPVRLVADLFPLRFATSDLMRVGDIPMLSLSAIPEVQTQFALKRATDCVVSSFLLLLLSPVFILIAFLVKLESPGPVFSRDRRVGRDQRPFNLLRFRTTAVSAEGALAGSFRGIETRVGRLLHRYSLDQLPQLLNICRGQMSLLDPVPVPLTESEDLPPSESASGAAHP